MNHIPTPGQRKLKVAGIWYLGTAGLLIVSTIMIMRMESRAIFSPLDIAIFIGNFFTAAYFILMGSLALKFCKTPEEASFLRTLAIICLVIELGLFVFNSLTLNVSLFVELHSLAGLVLASPRLILYFWGASQNRAAFLGD